MLFLALSLLATDVAQASSHREAPAIARDPSADLSDFYAFVNPNDASKVVFLVNVNPLSAAEGGPNFFSFDDDVLIELNVDSDGDGRPDMVWLFDFETTYNHPGDFLYNVGPIADPANINHTQHMRVRLARGGTTYNLTGYDIPVAPASVGPTSNPDGYNPMGDTPGPLTVGHIDTIGPYGPDDIVGPWRVFAGPRQDDFFVNLGGTFDLLSVGEDRNTLLGFNVSTVAIEIPLDDLTWNLEAPDPSDGNEVIAAWASTWRQSRRQINGDGTVTTLGDFVQVARLGMPLVNEVAVPVTAKDYFNSQAPVDDVQFLEQVCNPILPVYMEAVLGIENPLTCDRGLGFDGAVDYTGDGLVDGCREDLIEAFLIGLDGLNRPSGFALGGPTPTGGAFAAFDALRLNLTVPSGFPNGRLVGDDVVDTALSVMAGTLCAGSDYEGVAVADGVTAAGLGILGEFPFLGDPWHGQE